MFQELNIFIKFLVNEKTELLVHYVLIHGLFHLTNDASHVNLCHVVHLNPSVVEKELW